MTGEPIPADIQDFIVRHVDSVTQLEGVAAASGNPGETWDLSRTARRLYTTEQEVAEVLARLCADGLLSVNNGIYRYDCATPHEMKLTLDKVERLSGASEAAA